MPYELYDTCNQRKHYIFLDNDLFRCLKRERQCWESFFEYIDQNCPELLEDIEFIFHWEQLLEDLNQGKIIQQQIHDDPRWQQSIRSFQDHSLETINRSLENSFEIAQQLIRKTPIVQKNALVAAIEKSIGYGHPDSYPLIKDTLIKAKGFIDGNNYIDNLANEIAWNCITSFDFIKTTSSTKTVLQRKIYFDALTALWYKMKQSGTSLNLYRLLENRYITHVSSNNLESTENIKKFRMKSGSDLGDSWMVHYAGLGRYNQPVVSITMSRTQEYATHIEKYSKRIAILKQSLIDHKRDVEGWDVNEIPGTVLILNINKSNNYQVLEGYKIPFDTPFSTAEKPKDMSSKS